MNENTDILMTPIVTITWCAKDLVDEYGYTPEKAAEVLENISSNLEERSIELGWQVIETLVNDYESEAK